MWRTPSLILVLCCLVSAADEQSQDMLTGNDREMKEYDPGRWRIVDQYAVQDTSGWIPSGQTSVEEQLPVRRRIRKRKRRPQVISLTDSSSEESADHSVRRRLRPHRLDQFREPWEEVSDEFIRKPNNRRRIIPVYREDSSITSSLEGVVQIPSIGATITFEEADESKDSSGGTDTIKTTPEKIRDPFTALEEAEQKQKPIPNETKLETTSQESTSSTTAQNLKNILKQTNGELSLSEILQQKNLSLSELLMGNKKALSALTAKVSHEPTSTEPDAEVTKYKRLPPSIGARKNINRIFTHDHNSNEALTSRETLEAQRKRLALLHAPRDNKLYSEVTKYEVVTEAMTERRIFVPSHPKYYTSLDYVPEFLKPNDKEEKHTKVVTPEITSSPEKKIMTHKLFWPQSTTTKKSLIPKLKINLPITSAKLNKAKHITLANIYSSPKPTSIPEKAFKINLNEIFGFELDASVKQNETENTENESESAQPSMTPSKHITVKKDEPFKMTFNLGAMQMESTTMRAEVPAHSVPNLKDSSEKSKEITSDISTETSFTEKIKQVTAKEEIMEILKDPVTRERLSRILEMRNMTVEELVEQRERGSSQLHLADIFHNKTREPEPQGEPYIGHVGSLFIKNLPKSGRQQKSRVILPESSEDPPKTTEQSKVIFLPIPTKDPSAMDYEMEATEIDSEQKVEAETPRSQYTVTSFPTYKIESDKRPLNEQPQPFLPIWKGVYPDIFSGVHQGPSETRVDPTKSSFITNDFVDLQRLEEIDNKLSSKIKSEKFNVDVGQEPFDDSGEDDREQGFISLPSGVKSAIIASLVIIGLSLLVFVTILVVFRYSQKQKQRLCYRNSFSGSRIKSPILETEQQKRNIRTFMTETLGRKKNYYQSQAQSMSDNIWESDKKPF